MVLMLISVDIMNKLKILTSGPFTLSNYKESLQFMEIDSGNNTCLLYVLYSLCKQVRS